MTSIPAILPDYIPLKFETPRVVIRALHPDDSVAYDAAIRESYPELQLWIPWANNKPEPFTLEETRQRASDSYEKFLRAEVFNFTFFEKSTGLLLGGLNLFCHDWRIPHFEIGYWQRTKALGRGYVTESALALSKLAFEKYGANRVQLRCDPLNVKSCAVPERLGYVIEGELRQAFYGNLGRLCDTRMYARLNGEGLPPLDVKW